MIISICALIGVVALYVIVTIGPGAYVYYTQRKHGDNEETAFYTAATVTYLITVFLCFVIGYKMIFGD